MAMILAIRISSYKYTECDFKCDHCNIESSEIKDRDMHYQGKGQKKKEKSPKFSLFIAFLSDNFFEKTLKFSKTAHTGLLYL